MGVAAGTTISQEVFLGYMSTPENWTFFVQEILPDVIRGATKIVGGDYQTIASAQSVMMAVEATGSSYGQVIPDSVYETAKNPTPAAPAPQAPSGQAAAQGAQQSLKDELDSWGLGSLYDQAWAMKAAGSSDESIVAWIRTTDVYKQRFKGNVERQAAGLTPLAEADYLAYEEQARQVMRAAGLPAGYYDNPDDFANLIGKDVSPAELNARVQIGYDLLYQEDATTLAEAARLGLSAGDLTAAILDPDKALPVLQQRLAQAQIGGASIRSGFGQLTAGQLAHLQAQGIDAAAARSGFASLANLGQLRQGFAGEEAVSTEDLLAAQFGGNAEAQAKLSRRQRGRLAAFTGGGQYATSQRGVTGLGTAATTAS